MTMRELLTGAIAASLCLALAGPARAVDPKVPPVTPLPAPTVVGMKVVETPSLFSVGDSHAAFVIILNLVKGQSTRDCLGWAVCGQRLVLCPT